MAKQKAAELRRALAPRPTPTRLARLPPEAPPFNWVQQLCGNLAPKLASRLLACKRVDSPGPLPPPRRPAESAPATTEVNDEMDTAPVGAAPPVDAAPPIDDAAEGLMVRASPPHHDPRAQCPASPASLALLPS